MPRRLVSLALCVAGIVVGIAASRGLDLALPAGSTPPGPNDAPDAFERFAREGDFRRAAEVAATEVRAARRDQGEGDARVVSALNRLGEAFHGQGCYNEAAAAHREALAFLGKRADPDAVARTTCLLARAEKNIGLLDEAIAGYEAALSIARPALGKRHPVVALCLNGLANAIRRTDPDRATDLFEEALEIRVIALGGEHPDVAETRTDLAYHLVREGDTARALGLLEEAIPSIRVRLGPHHPDLALVLSILGSAQLVGGEYESAEHTFREVTAIYEVARQNSTVGANRTLRYKLATYGDLAASLLLQGRTEEAWPFLERSLSPGLTEQLVGEDGARPYADGVGPPYVSPLEHVQANLAPGTALVGWLDLAVRRDETFAVWGFVVRDQGKVRWVRLDAAESKRRRAAGGTALARFRGKILEDSAWPAPILDCREIDALAAAAYRERIAPLQPHLEGVTRIVVLSSKSWGDAPIEALLDEEGRALIESWSFTYAPSATAFAALNARAGAGSGPRRCLLVGDPRAGGGRDGPPGLAWARWEVLRVAEQWDRPVVLLGEDATEASLHRLAADGVLGRFDTIHFASHALGSSRLPEYSALVLGGTTAESAGSEPTSAAAPGDDGLLLPEEIASWRLGARLVTLSGCSTRGKHIHGEGFLGTAEAFLRAGARSVIASLWQVDDRSASLLMTRFYDAWEDGGRARADQTSEEEALRRAKRGLRQVTDARGRRTHAHPVYWASFVLVGAGAADASGRSPVVARILPGETTPSR